MHIAAALALIAIAIPLSLLLSGAADACSIERPRIAKLLAVLSGTAMTLMAFGSILLVITLTGAVPFTLAAALVGAAHGLNVAFALRSYRQRT